MRNFKGDTAAAATDKPGNDAMDEEEALNVSVSVEANTSTPAAAAQVADMIASAEEAAMNAEEELGANGKVHVYAEHEAIDVPLRPEEKRRLNWENGLYLAPLTTVGNLVSPPGLGRPLALTLPSHSADCACLMAQRSPFPRWLSRSRSCTARQTSSRFCGDTSRRRCSVSRSQAGTRTVWFLSRR